MTIVLAALPSLDGPSDGEAVCIGHWALFPDPSQPIRLVVEPPENPIFLRLVSVDGPPHQRSLATQVLASAGSGHRTDDVETSAEQAIRTAVQALTADAALLDECRVSLAQVVADDNDAAIGVIGDIHTYVMTSGYAAPEGPRPSLAILAGRTGPFEVSRLKLSPGEWLLLSNRPLESLEAPLNFPLRQPPSEYLSVIAARGQDLRKRPGVMVAYAPIMDESADPRSAQGTAG